MKPRAMRLWLCAACVFLSLVKATLATEGCCAPHSSTPLQGQVAAGSAEKSRVRRPRAPSRRTARLLAEEEEALGVPNASLTYAPGGDGNTSSRLLTGLAASFANLSGAIPSAIFGQTTLTYLDLHGNSLNGSIPTALCQLASLSFLYLSYNQISGPIPNCFSELTGLRTLQLRSNLLSGTVPGFLSALTNLQFLDLSYNKFTDPIPETIGSARNLTVVGLGTNLLTSSLPGPLCALKLLHSLNVSGNRQLTGGVPDCMAQLPLLSVFAASNTSLDGQVPACWGDPTSPLSTLQLPPSISCPSSEGSCCGTPSLSSAFCESCHGFCLLCQPGSTGLSPAAIAGICIGSLGVVVAIVGIVLFWRLRRKHAAKLEGWEEALQASAFHKFTLEEVKLATAKFSKDRVLGEGGFGTVYKGVGPRGQVWAIKRSHVLVRSEKERKEFETEVCAVSGLSHSHLVRLLGYCNENWEEILVYEYVSNGSLDKHIHCEVPVNELHEPAKGFTRKISLKPNKTAKGTPILHEAARGFARNLSRKLTVVKRWGMQGDPRHRLSFTERLQIAVGLAEALAYLHHGVSPPIVHRDVKPGNVLLDEKLQPKLADFGSLKTIANTGASTATRVVGTLGYLDPDYFRSQKVTTKIDVYSFGVVLLELITGRPVMVSIIPGGEGGNVSLHEEDTEDDKTSVHISDWVGMSLEKEGVEVVIDRCIYDPRYETCFQNLCHLARECTKSPGRSRPDMMEVVRVLKELLQEALALRAFTPEEASGKLISVAGPDEFEAGSSGQASWNAPPQVQSNSPEPK